MSSRKMTCSVAMASYNGSKYILEQLRSIEEQTVMPNEVIICDDGSKDNTVELVRQYASQSKLNIRLVQNEKNLGYSKNFEKAISLCDHDVVFLCDQDDVWDRNKVRRMVGEFEADEKLVFLFSDAYVTDENLHVFAESLWGKMWEPLTIEWNKMDDQEMFNLFMSGKFPAGCLAAAKREYLHQIIPFLTTHDRWIACCAPAFGNIKAVGDTLISYRRHSGSTTTDMHCNNSGSNGFIKRISERISAISGEILKKDYETYFIFSESGYAVCSGMAGYYRNSAIDTTYLQDRMCYLQQINEAKHKGMIARLSTLRKLEQNGLYNKFRSESRNIYRMDRIFMVLNSLKRKKNR